MREVNGAYLAENATVIGDVTFGAGASVWFGSVLRADVSRIHIGARTNVQDLSMIHPQTGTDVEISEDVTIGHHVVVHCKSIGPRALIGIGAVLLQGVEVGPESIIAAGCVVTPFTRIGPRSLVMGVPGKVIRPVKPEEVEENLKRVHKYVELARSWLTKM